MGKELSMDDEKLLELWKEGLSGSVLAERFGVSKGAIMGRLFRLRKMGVSTEREGLPSSPEGENPKVTVAKKPKVYRTKKVSFPPTRGRRKGDGISILELKMSSCRYIVGWCEEDLHLYCGKDQVQGSYCDAHAKLCYNPNAILRSKRKFSFSYMKGITDVGTKG